MQRYKNLKSKNSRGAFTSLPSKVTVEPKPTKVIRRPLRKYIGKSDINSRRLRPTTQTAFDNLGIPGSNIACNPRHGKFTKAFSFAVIASIYVVCVYQASVRIKTYFDNPIAVQVAVERRQDFSFPIVTFCPWYPLVFSRKLHEVYNWSCPYCNWFDIPKAPVFDLLLMPNVTVQNIWDFASINVSNIQQFAGTYNPFFKGDLQFSREEVTTFIGTCLSTKFARRVSYQASDVVIVTDILDKPSLDYWHYMIILHEDPTELPFLLVKGAGIPFHHETETDIAFTTTESVYVNTPQNPCKTAKEYHACLDACADNHIMSNVTCKLPYLKTLLLEDCARPEEARHTYHTTLYVYDNVEQLCKNCHRSCQENHYKRSANCIRERQPTRLVVILNNNFVLRIIENEFYDFVMFLGDIGGTVGFFLGMCLLNVVQTITSLVDWLIKVKRKPHFYGKERF